MPYRTHYEKKAFGNILNQPTHYLQLIYISETQVLIHKVGRNGIQKEKSK